MVVKKLSGHNSAQAQVRIMDNDDMILVSYSTPVIIIRDGWMEVTGLYSRTTIKHIGWFMREYLNGSYYMAKGLYMDGCKLNIRTGEVLPLV